MSCLQPDPTDPHHLDTSSPRSAAGDLTVDSGWIRSGVRYVANPPMARCAPNLLFLCSADRQRTSVALDEAALACAGEGLGTLDVRDPRRRDEATPALVLAARERLSESRSRLAVLLPHPGALPLILPAARRHVLVVGLSIEHPLEFRDYTEHYPDAVLLDMDSEHVWATS